MKATYSKHKLPRPWLVVYILHFIAFPFSSLHIFFLPISLLTAHTHALRCTNKCSAPPSHPAQTSRQPFPSSQTTPPSWLHAEETAGQGLSCHKSTEKISCHVQINPAPLHWFIWFLLNPVKSRFPPSLTINNQPVSTWLRAADAALLNPSPECMFWQKQRYFQLGVQGGLPRGSAFPADPRWVGGRAPTACLGSSTRGQVCTAQHWHSWQGLHHLAAPLEWIQSRIPAASGTLSKESTKKSHATSDHSEGSHLACQLPRRFALPTRNSQNPFISVSSVCSWCRSFESPQLCRSWGVGFILSPHQGRYPPKSACLHSDNTAFMSFLSLKATFLFPGQWHISINFPLGPLMLLASIFPVAAFFCMLYFLWIQWPYRPGVWNKTVKTQTQKWSATQFGQSDFWLLSWHPSCRSLFSPCGMTNLLPINVDSMQIHKLTDYTILFS